MFKNFDFLKPFVVCFQQTLDYLVIWIPDGALICVLNHVGQVLSWHLTSKLTFENVLKQLMVLKYQIDQQGSQLKEFYVDNCCITNYKKCLAHIYLFI